MDFDLSDDQKMLTRTVAELGKTEATVERFRKLRDADGPGWDKAMWKQMGELGWLGVPFPEALGGFGGKFVDAALILQELGKTLVPEPYLASVVLGGYASFACGLGAVVTRTPIVLLEQNRKAGAVNRLLRRFATHSLRVRVETLEAALAMNRV